MTEILFYALVQALGFLMFLFITAQIDAAHLEKDEFIPDHLPRNIQRALFLIFLTVVSLEPLHLISFILLWMGMFDLVLNFIRKDVTNIWYLGSTAKWDIFWSKHPSSYRAMRYITVALAIIIYILPYLYF